MKKKTEVNRIVLEVIGDDLKVEVIGNGGTLSNMLAAAMMDDPEFMGLVKLSFIKVLSLTKDSLKLDDDELDELEDEIIGRLSTDTWNKAIGHA
jgi:hypothetical protein